MREKLLQHWAKLSCLEENCQTMLEVKNLTRAITLAYQLQKRNEDTTFNCWYHTRFSQGSIKK